MTSNPTVVLKGGPEDLIAAAWFSLGFKPAQSLILTGLEGPQRRMGVILRVDLPEPTAERSQLRELVRGSIGPIVESPADEVAAIIVSEWALTDAASGIISVLRRQVGVLGLRLFEILGVTPTAYRSLRCHNSECCPAEGKPLEAVMASRTAATHVLKGDALAETEAELLLDVRPEPGLKPLPGPVPRNQRVTSTGPAGSARLTRDQRWQWWERWIEALGAAEAGGRMRLEGWKSASGVSGLSGALHDPFLRDAVMMHLLGAPRAQLSLMLDERYGPTPEHLPPAGRPHQHRTLDLSAEPDPNLGLDQDLDPDLDQDLDFDQERDREPDRLGMSDFGRLLARHPDQRRLSEGESVLAAAVRVAAAGDRAPGLAVLALLAWYQGRGGRSRLLAERARADDPEVSLIGLVEALLIQRVRPPWAQIAQEG